MTAGAAAVTGAAPAYLDRLDEAFELAAEAAGGASEQTLAVAGSTVRLRFAGDDLAALLTPALAHLAAGTNPEVPADLEIRATDLAVADLAMPTFPWTVEDVRERGEIRGFNDGAVRTQFEPDLGVLSMLDLERGRAHVVAEDARRLKWWWRAAPFRTILGWALAGPTRRLAHAGAVGGARAGALLVGAGGSGKSTTAVACALEGLGFAGDDYVVLDTAAAPVAHGLYATAKLTDGSLAMFPGLEAAVQPGSRHADHHPAHAALFADRDEKRVLDLARARPGALRARVAVSALVVPEVAPGRPTALTPTSPARALRALAPTTIYQLPGAADPAALRTLAELVRLVPCFALTIGGGPQAGARALAELLEELHG